MEIYHNKKIIRKYKLETDLIKLLDKIDKGIMETDVEWLHLKNLVESQNNKAQSVGTSTKNIKKDTPEVESKLNTIKLELLASNDEYSEEIQEEKNAKLNLDIKKQFGDSEEEFDSD